MLETCVDVIKRKIKIQTLLKFKNLYNLVNVFNRKIY